MCWSSVVVFFAVAIWYGNPRFLGFGQGVIRAFGWPRRRLVIPRVNLEGSGHSGMRVLSESWAKVRIPRVNLEGSGHRGMRVLSGSWVEVCKFELRTWFASAGRLP